jgi:hypothetical protein
VSLFIGVWEFRHSMLKLATQVGVRYRAAPVGVIAALVGVIGVLAFVSLFVRLDFL